MHVCVNQGSIPHNGVNKLPLPEPLDMPGKKKEALGPSLSGFNSKDVGWSQEFQQTMIRAGEPLGQGIDFEFHWPLVLNFWFSLRRLENKARLA